MPEARYCLEVSVQPDDIDELNHVNNAVYVRWIQEVAVAHWRTLATAEMQSDTVWVVIRHEIDYLKAALAGDAIRLETWVGEATRIRFARHTNVYRISNGQLLATALTLWCPIDAETMCPKRVSAEVRARFSS